MKLKSHTAKYSVKWQWRRDVNTAVELFHFLSRAIKLKPYLHDYDMSYDVWLVVLVNTSLRLYNKQAQFYAHLHVLSWLFEPSYTVWRPTVRSPAVFFYLVAHWKQATYGNSVRPSVCHTHETDIGWTDRPRIWNEGLHRPLLWYIML